MDLITLYITDSLINFTCGATCFAVWASRLQDRCLAFWGLGSLLHGVTAFGFPYLPEGIIGKSIGYSSFQFANILFWAGYRSFDQRRVMPYWLLSLPALMFMTSLSIGSMAQDEAFIDKFIAVIYCMISGAQVIYIMRGMDSWYCPRAVSAYAVISILLSKLITTFITGYLITEHTSETLFALTDQVMTVVFTLAIIAMIGQRNLGELRTISQRDPLTGALNRAGLSDALAHGGLTKTLMLLDIDHFKAINDCHGHDAGDEVLRELVARTRSTMHKEGELIRMGGEEFLIVTDKTDLVRSQDLADRVRKGICESPVIYGATNIFFTISIGVALAAEKEPFSKTLKRADVALYQAKNSGRDRIIYDDPADAADDLAV